MALTAATTPAAAQLAGSATVSSDYIFRGVSIARGHPTLDTSLSYDDASGLYADASISGVLGPDARPAVFSVQGNIGYARRLGSPSAPVLDLGVIHADYRAPDNGTHTHYTELYFGVLTPVLSSHIYVSPDYLRPQVVTVYGDLTATIRPGRRFRISAHAGLLDQLGGPRPIGSKAAQYDVELAIGRRIGSIDLGAAWSFRGTSTNSGATKPPSQNHGVVHATWTF